MSRSRREILSVLIATIALFALVATSYAASMGSVVLPLGNSRPSVVPPPKKCKKNCPKKYDEPSVVVPPKPKPAR
jgi:hypothetical protein